MITIWRNFMLMYLLGVAMVAALMWGIAYFFPDLSASANSMGVIVPLIAAMQVGQLHMKRTGGRISGGFAWQAAVLCAVTSMAISLGLAWLIVRSGADPELSALTDEMMQPGNIQVTAIIFAALTLLLVVVIRIGFAVGARTEAKAAERRARKG